MRLSGAKSAFVAAAMLAAALSALPALAQAPAAAPVPGWTGLWGDVGGGFGMWTGDTQTANTATGACDLCVVQTQGGRGGFVTLGLGFDYQFTPQLVGGVFGDIDFSNFQGTLQDQGPFFVGRLTQDRAWALGARMGWLVTPMVMPYIDGGFTDAHFSGAGMVVAFNGAGTGFHTPAFSRPGWFVGAGVEGMMMPGWYLRGEYRYANYGTKILTDTSPPNSPTDNIVFKPVTQTFRVALVYKFNSMSAWGAQPVVASFLAPATSWTGFYIAGGGGYGMWTADTTTRNPLNATCILCQTQTQGGSGGFGTIGGGFDYQFTPNIVAGVFGDFDLGRLSGTIQDQGPFFAGRISENRAFAFGGRAGWLITPALLPYVDFGFTQAHFDKATMVNTFTGAATGFSTPAFSTSGWFAGLGAEARIFPSIPGLFVRGEYRHAEYGTKVLADTAPGTGPGAEASITLRPTSETFRAALVYKLNFFGH